jgi:phage gp36-like protein
MAVYAAFADLVARYGEAEIAQLTDRDTPPSGAADEAVAERALLDADAEIDAYLAGRYALPLASPPPVLRRVACDIARYRLWDDRASEEVRLRYEDARRLLQAIADGHVALGAAASGVAWSAPRRVMRDLEY